MPVTSNLETRLPTTGDTDVTPPSTRWPGAAGGATIALGLALLVAAFFVPVEHTLHGGRTLEGWWVAMIGLSAVVTGAAWHSAWRRAGALVAMLILGMTAQLTLTRPHWAMSLRVSPGALDRPEHYLSYGVLALQLLVVAALAWPRVGPLLRVGRSALTLRSVTLAAVIFLVCAANIAVDYPAALDFGFATLLYARRLAAAALIFVVNLLLLWQIGLALPADALRRIKARITTLLSLPGDAGPDRPLDTRLPWYVATFVLGVTVFFTLVVLDAGPQFGDEAVYLFMARTFASGAMAVPAPLVPEAFDMYLVEIQNGLRYGVFIPGWPLTLAVGMFFGVPWLVNPILGALSIPLAHALTTRLVDRGTANVVVLLLATSPWFLILSSAYQPHAVTLFAALITWLGIHHARANGGHLMALAAGLAAGVAFTVRPMDGVIIGGAGALYAILALGSRRAPWSTVLSYLVGCVLTGSVALYINYVLTGDPLLYPMNVYLDRLWGPDANRLGFGAEVGQLWGVLDRIPGHGWRDVLVNLNQNFFAMNFDLLGWGVGSLFFVAVHVLWGRLTTMDRCWLVFIGAAIAIYSLYWFNGGPDYGPRYWYSTIFAFVLLSARGLNTLVLRLKERVSEDWSPGARVGILAAVLALTSLTVFDSWRSVSKYLEYRSYVPAFHELLEANAFGENGLVIVDAERQGEYSALALNDLVPGEDGPIFARDLGAEVTRALVAAYPGRPVYRATMRLTPSGKRVTVTPLEPAVLEDATNLPPTPSSAPR